MIIKIANKVLRQPIELFIDDALWANLSGTKDQNDLNQKLLNLALKHIAKHGYNIGFCSEQNRMVTLSECMKCGIAKGWASGPENLARWENCKKNRINYSFKGYKSPYRVLTNGVKDQTILEKMQGTKEEQRLERGTISGSPNNSL
jgi:hypothetical protein